MSQQAAKSDVADQWDRFKGKPVEIIHNEK
jgi:hypothetical protein